MDPLPEVDGVLLEPDEPLEPLDDGELVLLLPLSAPAPPPEAPDDGVLLGVALPLSVAAGPLDDGVPLELPLLLSEPEEPLVDGVLLELPLLLSEPEDLEEPVEPEEPLVDGVLLELPLLLSDPDEPEEPLDDGMLPELPLLELSLPELDIPLPEEPLPDAPLLSMLLPAVVPLEDFCFELWDLSFFLVVLCFDCVPDSVLEPAALLPELLPADCCCIRNSSARCSTAAALAGSVELVMPLSELCA